MMYNFQVDYKINEGDTPNEPVIVTGSILSRYTDYEGKKPCEMLIIETVEGELKHVPMSTLKSKAN